MKNALILLAGGVGKRFDKTKKSTPKQFKKIGKYNLIEFFLKNLDHKLFGKIQIVVKKHYIKKYLGELKKNFPDHNISFINSGKNRQESSKNGIISLQKYNPKIVLIHDVARPLTSKKLIKKIIKSLKNNIGVSPYTYQNDFIKHSSIISNDKKIMYLQTPQGFRYNEILKAHKIYKNKNFKDDTSLLSLMGLKIKFVKGEKINFKITYKEDFEIYEKLILKNYRHGIGYDIHKFNYNSKKILKLCGVKINYFPLLGHSDADVGYHAICDSILGALSLRDIGYYFNNKNNKWKNMNSEFFIKFCKKQLDIKEYEIVNLDINFICEEPKINKYVVKMKSNISKLLNMDKKNIAIKATTNEKVGFIGKGEAIAAESIVQIKNV